MVYKDNFVAVVVCQGDILREDGNTVHLPFGADYSLKFKNKEARKAVVTVNVDGQDVISGRGIIVPGGGDVELEGFMDANGVVGNKFRFIQKTKQIAEFRGDRIDDGMITVQYRFEQPEPEVKRIVEEVDYYRRYRYPYPRPYPRPHPTWYGPEPRLRMQSAVGRKGPGGSSAGPIGSSNYLRGHVELMGCCHAEASNAVPIADEGITVKGAESDQHFSTGYTRPLETNIHTITILLKGKKGAKSLKAPIKVRTKLQCPTCGSKHRSDSKFCSKCATAL